MKNIIKTIFTICVMIFILMGVTLVGIQIFSIFTLDGALSIRMDNLIKPVMIKFSVVVGILGFINGYFSKKS